MDYRVQLAITLMEKNPQRNLTLNEIADSVSLSPSRLSHLFKAETGLGPLQYQRLLKMRQAKELLQTTFLSVKEIMIKVGVKDESHFFRDFKKAHGVTPVQYRRARPMQNPISLFTLAVTPLLNWLHEAWSLANALEII